MQAEDIKELWGKVVAELRKELGEEAAVINLKPAKPHLVGKTLVLDAPNTFVAERLEAYRPAITKVLPAGVAGLQVVVGYKPPAPSSEPEQGNRPARTVESAPAPSRRQSRSDAQPMTSPEGFLPQVWGEAYRAIPSDLVRSALFTSNVYGEKSVRPKRDHQELVALSNMRLLVTGEELNQFDERVFMQLLHYQRRVRLGEAVRFSLREVCDDLGVHPTGRNLRLVREAIDRLQKNTIDLKVQGRGSERGYSGHLINELVYSHTLNKDAWGVTFSPQIAGLLARGALTKVRHELQSRIGSSLALWLMHYYSSHREPFPEKVATFKARSGSSIKTERRFKQALREALGDLEKVGFLKAWRIDDAQNVHVTRSQDPLD